MSKESYRRLQPSRGELVLEPLSRARDLLRVLSNALCDAGAATQKTIDAAQRASEQLIGGLSEIETEIGRRRFTRELYRAWATILEVREVVVDDALLRVYYEIEESLETTRRILRRLSIGQS